LQIGSRIRSVCAAIAFAVSLGACAQVPGEEHMTSALGPPTGLPASLGLVQRGQQQFTAGNFGSASNDFAKSIETDSMNADAWLGLAASYDQIGRFDEADKAYTRVQELIGSTPSVLNNLGYSYLLRGQLDKSRHTLSAAHQLEPGNVFILNNIEILNKRLTELGQAPLAVH
jgi:Flp pilus assembly protein TadD